MTARTINSFSIIGYIVLVLAIIGLMMNRALVAEGPVGITVQAAAVILMIWARAVFGARSFHAAANPTEGGIVSAGPYRFIRHPIYASVLYFIWAGILTHLRPETAGIGILGLAGAWMRIMAEERLLFEKYPEYASYAASTKRIIPFIV